MCMLLLLLCEKSDRKALPSTADLPPRAFGAKREQEEAASLHLARLFCMPPLRCMRCTLVQVQVEKERLRWSKRREGGKRKWGAIGIRPAGRRKCQQTFTVAKPAEKTGGATHRARARCVAACCAHAMCTVSCTVSCTTMGARARRHEAVLCAKALSEKVPSKVPSNAPRFAGRPIGARDAVLSEPLRARLGTPRRSGASTWPRRRRQGASAAKRRRGRAAAAASGSGPRSASPSCQPGRTRRGAASRDTRAAAQEAKTRECQERWISCTEPARLDGSYGEGLRSSDKGGRSHRLQQGWGVVTRGASAKQS
eukprot:420306-Pleurochrysis_carterae.AAC.2